MKRICLCFLLAGLAGCASSQDFIVLHPPSDAPVRVGLLLPMSTKHSELKKLARALSDAAQMALFDSGKTRLILIPADTKGTPQGAQAAMERLVEKNVDIVLGPLLSSSVKAVSALAAQNNIPVIGFSSDERVVSDRVYLMGFSPRQQVARIIAHAHKLGVKRIAAFLPRTAYGRLVRTAFVESSEALGFEIDRIETYAPSIAEAMEPARRLAGYAWRRKTRDQEMRRLEREVARAQIELRLRGPRAKRQRFVRGSAQTGSSEDSVPAETRLAQAKAAINRLKKIDALGEVSYQAILFAEGGLLLRGLVQLLPNFDITTRQVFFLGTGLWDDPRLSRERPLHGARFAAPPIDNASILIARMRNEYRRTAPRLATLSYDAVGLARTLAEQSDPPFEHSQLTQEDGFSGIDGIFRFPKRRDQIKGALAERGLAVIEIKRRSREVISDAPEEFFSDTLNLLGRR